ncbi:HpcH/HpaI aldolase family protein [Megalodesulfovibrio paquesii]
MDRSILKKKLHEGPAFGTFINLPAACVPEILAYSGLDFGIIDLEHAGFSDELVEAMLRSGDIHNLPLIIRPRELNRAYVLRALDQGACGVEIPQIDTVAEVEQAVSYTKYPPRGVRGVAGVRATGYGANFFGYLNSANDDLMTIVHCETKAFLDILPEAVKVPGLDSIFLGPFDLSVSLGYPGQLDHPVVKDAIAYFADVCNKAGMITGTYVRDVDDAKLRISQGFRFIAYAVDITVLGEKYKAFRAAV